MLIAFATGSGRCGTQTFGAQMQRLKGVVGVHEGRQQIYVGRRDIAQAPHLVSGSPAGRGWNLEALRWRRRFFADKPDQRAYCEAAHYFATNLELVAEVFPTAKIVHLLRDPAEQVWSMMNHAGKKIYWRQGRHTRNDSKWTRWQDCYPLYPDAHTRAEGFAHYWQDVNQAIERSPLETLLVRTKEMMEAETWVRILEFLKLDGSVKAPNLVWNARPLKRKRIPMPPEVENAVRRICTWRPR